MIDKLLALRRLHRNLSRPPAELRALQERRLQAVIAHAYAEVPYYRELFERAGIKPGDIRSLGDLRHVPLTTKADLRAAGLEATLARGSVPDELVHIRTSGSTGHPFDIYLSRAEYVTRNHHQLRVLHMAGFRPRDRLTALGPFHAMPRRLHQRLGLFRSERISVLLPMEEQIARLRAQQPTVLWAYPSVLAALLRTAGCRLADLCRPRLLITSAEAGDAPFLARCRDGLPGLEHRNFYGSMETGRIAWECRAHRGLHVNVDHLIVEIVALPGAAPDGNGALGETVVTTLNARVMPFIRYRLGDLAGYTGEPCPCGVHFPLLTAPPGRRIDVIRLPSGRVLTAIVLRVSVRKFPRIEQYCAVQKAPDHLVIDLVAPGGLPDDERSALERIVRDQLGEPIRLDLRLVDTIERQGTKVRDFRSELPDIA